MFHNVERLGEFIGGPIPYTFLLPLLEDGLEYEEEKVRKKVSQELFRSLKSTFKLSTVVSCPNARIKLYLLSRKFMPTNMTKSRRLTAAS